MDDKMIPGVQKGSRICDRHRKSTAYFLKVYEINQVFLQVWNMAYMKRKT
jgi:hypothetical protein